MAGGAYPEAPQVAVGAFVFLEKKILLIKRNRPPGKGLWAIPGGRVKLGETLQQAAEREIREETGIIIKAQAPVYTFDLIERDQQGAIRFHYVIVDLLADYVSGDPVAGDDASEVRWIGVDEWDGLPTSQNTVNALKQLKQFRIPADQWVT